MLTTTIIMVKNIAKRNWFAKWCQVTDLFDLFIVPATLEAFSGDYTSSKIPLIKKYKIQREDTNKIFYWQLLI